MLLELSVKNLAVVEALEVSFEPGMSTITGETGAGKSILLNSLGLALGVRADKSMVRSGAARADVSATFLLEHNPRAQALLNEQALDGDTECVLRRVIGADGRSKAFINGVSMPLTVLKQLGECLVDIHGQNEHQLLLKPAEQLALLDGYADNAQRLSALDALAREHRELSTRLTELQDNQESLLQQQELYQHQLDELQTANLSAEELQSIEKDYRLSANLGQLVTQVSGVLAQLESDQGVNAQLSSLSYELSKAQALDEALGEASELLEGAQVQVQECVYALNDYLSRLDMDEERMQLLEARMSELHDLGRKHHCQFEELLEVQEKLEARLSELGAPGASLEHLNKRLKEIQDQYQVLADELSTSRAQSAKTLSAQVSEIMQTLGMPGSEFEAALQPKPPGVHLGGNESVDFLVRTNMGQLPKPLKKIASGGELSRISLAISVVGSSSDYTPTIVFDEVDVGISGAVAQTVGEKLKALAKQYQVLCITHLAQVACFGDTHFKVSKTQHDEGASTQIDVLSNQARIKEVARILSGSQISDKALEAAAAMIKASA